MFHVTSDSCSDMGPELLAKHQIRIIPLNVLYRDVSYKDTVNITTQRLFDLVGDSRDLPKTSAPSIAEFVEFFRGHGDILHISIGSKLSASYQSAVLAAQSLPEQTIHIVDSHNLSAGIGLLALFASDLKAKGMSIDEVVATLEQALPRVHTSFVIDTLDYLHKGGRCTSLEAVVGSMLKIRPVIEMRPDGTLGVRRKVGGARKKALATLLHDFDKHRSSLDHSRVFVTHTGCNDDAQYLSDAIHAMEPDIPIHITTAGATIASHCGPNTIGILYMTL